MAKSSFRNKVKDVKDISFWAEETFKEYAESHKDIPIGAYVILFSRTPEGRVVALSKRSFDYGAEGLTKGDLIKALEDAAFSIRFEVAIRSREINRNRR